MMKKVLMLLALACFVVLPTQAKDSEEDAFQPSRQELKEKKKSKKKNSGKKFKWYKSLKKAQAVAEKENTTCFVLYTNTKTCKFCKLLNKEILESKEFKSAKGIGVGFATDEPVEEYGLGESMPSGVILGPGGDVLHSFKGYNENMTPEDFVKMLEERQPAPAEE